jgi:hypothetical protein
MRKGFVQVSGRLPPEVILRVVRQNADRYRLCYENGLRTHPKLAGRVAVKFEIGNDGAVKNLADGETDLPDAAVVACIHHVFVGLRFPSPEGGGTVRVIFPLRFSPGGEEAAEPGTAVCAASLPAGEACSARGACTDGLACRGHVCSSDPEAAAGGRCMEEDDCQPGLYCSRVQRSGLPRLDLGAGVCAARKPDGAPCTSSLQCSGICIDHVCTGLCGAH